VHDEAIRTFLLHDHGRVVRAVAAVCGSRERAEDAVQDALVDVRTKNRQVDDLTGWVASAAINRARSRWRTQAAERRAFDRLAAQPATRSQAGAVEDAAPPDFDAQVAGALRDLPRMQRSVVALHYLLDMSVADVAGRLGLAEGTVKTHLHRARETMRAALGTPPEAGVARGEVRHARR
jgi:RNA polymerase sigma-70 factor (ECF subfamily)